MKDIILKSARLIATDYESSKIIERLKSEGVYGQEDNQWQSMNIVLVSSVEGVANIPNMLSKSTPAKRNIIIKTNPSLEIDDNINYYSVLSFFNGADPYKEIKALLYFIRTNGDTNRNIAFDEYEIFDLIKGRNMISTASYSYNENVDEVINELKKIKLHNNRRYLLLFTYEHNNEATFLDILPVNNYLESFPKDATVCWNIIESSVNQVTLFTSISI
ncbi:MULTISPECIES: hypothetical protein [Prevotella]|uniref:Uncharacterized protein n=1 Tax=Prevotella herbatica TaxID=2801997 RepID=A0ABM7P0X1_9BACT|nr:MULTISPECIES: hypothetical protein [Prevotella]MDN5553764.1 hypothetical protein [Prevotella sp.]BCS86422.1 hypothetical protein prwr041_23150 [Prevotella herbatica]